MNLWATARNWRKSATKTHLNLFLCLSKTRFFYLWLILFLTVGSSLVIYFTVCMSLEWSPLYFEENCRLLVFSDQAWHFIVSLADRATWTALRREVLSFGAAFCRIFYPEITAAVWSCRAHLNWINWKSACCELWIGNVVIGNGFSRGSDHHLRDVLVVRWSIRHFYCFRYYLRLI